MPSLRRTSQPDPRRTYTAAASWVGTGGMVQLGQCYKGSDPAVIHAFGAGLQASFVVGVPTPTQLDAASDRLRSLVTPTESPGYNPQARLVPPPKVIPPERRMVLTTTMLLNGRSVERGTIFDEQDPSVVKWPQYFRRVPTEPAG